MHNSKLFRGLVALAITAGTLSTSAANADSTWITDPSLSYVSFVGEGNSVTSNGPSISSQSNSFQLTFKSSASNSGKFAQVNFFELSTGLQLSPNSSPLASTTGCEQQVLSGNRNSCMFKLDSNGNASVTVLVSGASKTSSFKYLLLTGPNINQSQVGIARFALPKGKVSAVNKTVQAYAGGSALVRFKIADGKTAKPGMKVKISVTGIRSNISTRTATADSKGLVWVYIANTESKLGETFVTATIQGGTSKATAKIWWIEEPLTK